MGSLPQWPNTNHASTLATVAGGGGARVSGWLIAVAWRVRSVVAQAPDKGKTQLRPITGGESDAKRSADGRAGGAELRFGGAD